MPLFERGAEDQCYFLIDQESALSYWVLGCSCNLLSDHRKLYKIIPTKLMSTVPPN